MPIAPLIAGGIGFAPGSVKYIPVGGLTPNGGVAASFSLRDGAGAVYGATGLDGSSADLGLVYPGQLFTFKLRNDSGIPLTIDESGSANFGLTIGADPAAAVANGAYYTITALCSHIPSTGVLSGVMEIVHSGGDTPFNFTFTWQLMSSSSASQILLDI